MFTAGLHYLSNLATEKYEAVRGTVARFLDARIEDEIIFNSGTTEGDQPGRLRLGRCRGCRRATRSC